MVIIGTGVDLVVSVIFVKDQPGIDISDVTGDINFLSEDENLRKIVHSIVGFLGDSNIAIDSEGAVHEHSEGVHELLTSGIASCDEVTAAIELVEIGGAIHGAETGVPLVIELRKAEIVLRRGLIRGEAGDGVRRISDDSIAEASFETGQNGGADTGDAGIARSVFIVGDSHVANVANT